MKTHPILRWLGVLAATAALHGAHAALPQAVDAEFASAPLPLAGPAESVGTLALDANSLTTDQNINTPTSWWVYYGVTPSQIGTYLGSNGARLTELKVESVSSGVPRFTVRMVRNSGSYAATGGWWWYYGLTAAQVSSYINANGARLIDIEPYDIGGGNIRFAVVMVKNSGSAARAWWWYHGVTSSQISSFLSANNARLIDLDNYNTSSGRRYAAIMVANTGVDAETWQWWVGQSLSSVNSRVASFGGRVIKLDRNSDGTYNFVQLKNSGTNASAWWHYYGFTSMTALLHYAGQLAVRPVTIDTYLNSSGQRRWNAAFIDNANTETRRMRNVYARTFLDANGNPTRGIFSAHLKQVGGSELVKLNDTRQAETASALKVLHLLHGMRQVQLGNTTLGSDFVYYDYRTGTLTERKNACPDPSLETDANRRTDYDFETGLDQMMVISDNRTTRGVVLRYGMSAINTTGSSIAGLKGTQIRHNIGCAYRDFSTSPTTTNPSKMRNNTTAWDLARVYEKVWDGTALTSTNNARAEFLESANPATGAGSALQAIINAEAAALGKSSIASSFGSNVRWYSKGGSYNTCLTGNCNDAGSRVIVRSLAGLIRVPIKSNGVVAYRNYSFGHFVSDVPVSCWEDNDPSFVSCSSDTNYTNAFSTARAELFRSVVRSALQTW
ncbi:MAG: serine hydrolase [Rubrivivax sp.]|jgi:beta-lactamase class A|nr:serine hydrolase [Rubrivivax sp.]